ncbi:MAG: carbon-nitrogen hydrolase family protein, partial [Acidobacteriota bacterium]|nr:carbon-nitrogen hydrolase family protein [Acidobacteriota bacterium]
IENQCFVIAANQIGEHMPGVRSGGRSTIVDPWGIPLATAPDSETAIVAELDFGLLADIRARLPALTHRRDPRLYERPVSQGGA